MILTSFGQHLEIDTEDMEGYNSLIKIQARAAPTIGAHLLSARVNRKADIGFATKEDRRKTPAQLLRMASAFHEKLMPFAHRRAIRGTITSVGRYAHAPLLQTPTPHSVAESLKLVDPSQFGDLASDPKFRWAAACNSLLNSTAKPQPTFNHFYSISGGYDCPGEGASLYMVGDAVRSVHMLTEWVVRGGRIRLREPFRAITSVELFKSLYDSVHAGGDGTAPECFTYPIDWSRWSRAETSFPALTPGDDGEIGDRERLFTLLPGLEYVPVRAPKAPAQVLQDGAETQELEDVIIADMREAYGDSTSGRELEEALEKLLEEQEDLADRIIDAHEAACAPRRALAPCPSLSAGGGERRRTDDEEEEEGGGTGNDAGSTRLSSLIVIMRCGHRRRMRRGPQVPPSDLVRCPLSSSAPRPPFSPIPSPPRRPLPAAPPSI